MPQVEKLGLSYSSMPTSHAYKLMKLLFVVSVVAKVLGVWHMHF